jgi:hypothetical protein
MQSHTSSIARRSSWRKYDAKRQGAAARNKKRKARRLVEKAVREGLLKYTGKCAKCHQRALTVLHHEDYDKPLDVLELCLKCHRAKHPRLTPSGKVV